MYNVLKIMTIIMRASISVEVDGFAITGKSFSRAFTTSSPSPDSTQTGEARLDMGSQVSNSIPVMTVWTMVLM